MSPPPVLVCASRGKFSLSPSLSLFKMPEVTLERVDSQCDKQWGRTLKNGCVNDHMEIIIIISFSKTDQPLTRRQQTKTCVHLGWKNQKNCFRVCVYGGGGGGDKF
jgi:hypothetical protein